MYVVKILIMGVVSPKGPRKGEVGYIEKPIRDQSVVFKLVIVRSTSLEPGRYQELLCSEARDREGQDHHDLAS